jgi:type II secretory ATPase GspE/PulE/Tfp pilus assembly ATPase PilB-like protein
MIQMQVHEEIGFTFSRALRSILRHDPDVILVGEIRDSETSEIAIRMSMTGHLVLSTLHTNDAASTIARLIDMGQEPFLLATSILCVVAQRLLRRLCPYCREPYHPEAATFTPLHALKITPPQWLHRGKGCERCRKSGYLGRTIVDEIFPIDEDFRNLIMTRAPSTKFLETARGKGIKTMIEDGWQRVLEQQTTLEEVLRVIKALEG